MKTEQELLLQILTLNENISKILAENLEILDRCNNDQVDLYNLTINNDQIKVKIAELEQVQKQLLTISYYK